MKTEELENETKVMNCYASCIAFEEKSWQVIRAVLHNAGVHFQWSCYLLACQITTELLMFQVSARKFRENFGDEVNFEDIRRCRSAACIFTKTCFAVDVFLAFFNRNHAL